MVANAHPTSFIAKHAIHIKIFKLGDAIARNFTSFDENIKDHTR